jgi:hypothetical protein
VAAAATSEPRTPLYLERIEDSKEISMRSLLLFFLGVPIPVIILIALFFH